MADKSKTIKGATDKELDDLIRRLRKESEAQSLIGDIKRKSSSGYIPYDEQQGVSTEVPVESLYHFGIPGMRWGRRKGRSATPHGNSAHTKVDKINNNSEDHDKKMDLKKKKLSEMSNADLKAFTTRLQLEKQYKDLTKAEISPGRKWLSEVISSSSKQLASTYITKYAGKGLDKLIAKAATKTAKAVV